MFWMDFPPFSNRIGIGNMFGTAIFAGDSNLYFIFTSGITILSFYFKVIRAIIESKSKGSDEDLFQSDPKFHPQTKRERDSNTN